MRARKSTIWLLSLALLVGVRAGVVNADDPKGEKHDGETVAELTTKLRMLSEERVRWAARCLEATQAAHEAGTITLDVLLDASRRLRDAELETATSAAGRMAALKSHFERVFQYDRKIEALWNEGSKGGSAAEFAMVRVERQAAQIAVLKARIEELKVSQTQP